MASNFPHLLSPKRIGNVEVRNRLVMPAHGTQLTEGSHPTPEHAAYYAARARGGVGVIIGQAAAVHPTAGRAHQGTNAWEEGNIPYFRLLVDAIHPHGAKIFQQLHHAGRATSGVDTLLPVWSSSAAPGYRTYDLTHAMTKEEIQEIHRAFARSAVNMKKATMDGVEIHGAHGYLVQQFLSPLNNFRTDEYGGSLRNRARFALELVHTIRQAVGRDFVVGMRMSADELEPGGLTLEETTQYARWLEETGELDYISVSHSTNTSMSFALQQADMSFPQAPYIHLAAGIKKATKGIPIFGVCRIIDPVGAENIIADGKADMVCMVRAQIADPEIGLKLMEGRPQDIRQCIGCNQGCNGRAHHGKPIGCTINPEAGREWELGQLAPAPRRKSVVIVGGGPAGMEAARVAALRGHLVALYEKGERLGGAINTLVKAPLRQDFGNIVAWEEYQLRRLGVVVKLNTEATPERLREEEAEVVIVATGSVPDVPKVLGAGRRGSPNVVSVDDILERRVPVPAGKQVVLLDADGHQKSCSTALFLAEQGAKVHMVTQADAIGADITMASRPPAIQRLKDKRVAFHTECWVKEVRGRTVVLEDKYNHDEAPIEDVELIVAATTNKASTSLYDALKAEGRIPQVVAVGDCVSPRRAIEAIREGHMAARFL